MLRAGEVIAGQYRIERPLGEGGMAVVYQATDTQSGHAVAVKVMHAHLLADKPQLVERFRLEARLMLRLSQPSRHPAVMHVEQVISQPKLQAIVMPLIPDGLGLDAWLRAHGPMPEPQAIALMLTVLDGLAFIHANDIIHRDLKPSNILLVPTPGGGLAPVIADLGIARDLTSQDDLVAASATSTANTPSDDVNDSPDALGSPPYMAPELFDSGHEASAASDLYALGATLFELLTGQPPFVIDSIAAHVLRVSTLPPPSLLDAKPDASPWLSKVLAASMAQDPAERFPLAAAFAEALQSQGASAAALFDDDPAQITTDYRVNHRIGRGPVATVFDCTDTNLNVPVALKRLRGLDPGRRARFVHEARSQAALHQGRPHPNVAAIRHVVANADSYALVVERVKGSPWDAFWEANPATLPLALSLGTQLADALDYAHERGVYHRNLKPSNVLIADTPDGPRVKVTDFGMDAVHGDTPSARLSIARRSGALPFLPPEAAASAPWTPAADLYMAVALILQALLGRLPPPAIDADGAPAPLSDAGLNPAQRALPDLPPASAALLSSCLSSSPADRPASAAALRDALLLAQDEALALLPPDESLSPTTKRSPFALIAAALLVLIGGGVAFALLSSPPAPPPAADPEPAPTSPPIMSDADFMQHISALQSQHQQAVFSECVAKLLTDPAHKDTVRALNLKRAETNLLLSIDADGALQEITIPRDDLAAIGMGQCISSLAQTWSYPAAHKPMRVTMPWPLDL
jgi:serine/threonine protein kinase